MSVEYVTYRKKKLPIKIGYRTLKKLKQEHNVEFTDDMGDDLAVYELILFYALEQGHRVEAKPFSFKMEEMEDILDDCFFEFVEKVANFFPQELLEKTMGEAGKKKK